jgi:hypothetical protein
MKTNTTKIALLSSVLLHQSGNALLFAGNNAFLQGGRITSRSSRANVVQTYAIDPRTGGPVGDFYVGPPTNDPAGTSSRSRPQRTSGRSNPRPSSPRPDTRSGPTYADDLEARLSSINSGYNSPPVPNAATNTMKQSLAQQIFANGRSTKVQGGTLKTWNFNSPSVEAVHVGLKTNGRPLDADIELWQGPDNTPVKMRVYGEDGYKRPFTAMIATPRAGATISLRNIGHMEFPLDANVIPDTPDLAAMTDTDALQQSESLIIQGGALRTYPFDTMVKSIQILLNTDGRPLNARIELLQGPNNVKQVVELYTEDGLERPFFMVMESPGSGNVVRIVNTATVEFPLSARVEEYAIDDSYDEFEPVMGGW